MNAWFEAKAYVRHLIYAGGPHSVHSPSVFELITKILVPQRHFQCFETIEHKRTELLKDKRLVSVLDLGAGSRKDSGHSRQISSIAKHVLQDKKCAQSLFRIAEHYRPKTIIELGTSLGITTSYLASASSSADVYSIEGSSEIADIAKENINQLGLTNIKILTGNFDEVLPELIKKIGTVDMIIVDGNHRYAPTIKYFEEVVPYCHEKSILIFDDIHWSGEMEMAWDKIKINEKVKISIDFFHYGVLLFNNALEKQHFCLRLP